MSSYPSWLPWESFPSLHEGRLRIIAEIIRDVRSECVRTHEPSKGDEPWVLGCRAYRRTCFALAEAAKEHDWLTLVEPQEKASSSSIQN